MSRVTSKLQVTIPKVLADAYAIAPGSDVVFEAAGEVIRLVPAPLPSTVDVALRLELFDAATARQRARSAPSAETVPVDRGWTRDELYDRALRR